MDLNKILQEKAAVLAHNVAKFVGKANELVRGHHSSLKNAKDTIVRWSKDPDKKSSLRTYISNSRAKVIKHKHYFAAGASFVMVAAVSAGLLMNIDTGVMSGKGSKSSASVKDANTEGTGFDYLINESIMKAQNGNSVLSATALFNKEMINDMSKPGVSGYAVSVNSKQYGFFKSEDEANALVGKLKSDYSKPSMAGAVVKKVFFRETVKVVRTYRPAGSFLTFSDVKASLPYFKNGANGIKTHTVADGETFWDIAVNNHISVEELISANPGLDAERIKPGDKVNLKVLIPIVNVCVLEDVNYKEPIYFGIRFEGDKALEKGKTKVVTEGKRGEKQVHASVIRVNGKIASKSVISEKTISAPVTKVVAQGKKLPAFASADYTGSVVPTGDFSRPMSRGYVSSGFGMRWGQLHTGIDIATQPGAGVTASDGGVVESAGYAGPYGKCIVVNHGGGYKTRYAHLSVINVSAGERVGKGERIGLSGATGNVTGPHLHFEVIRNGTPVNPAGYVNF